MTNHVKTVADAVL